MEATPDLPTPGRPSRNIMDSDPPQLDAGWASSQLAGPLGSSSSVHPRFLSCTHRSGPRTSYTGCVYEPPSTAACHFSCADLFRDTECITPPPAGQKLTGDLLLCLPWSLSPRGDQGHLFRGTGDACAATDQRILLSCWAPLGKASSNAIF